MTWHHSHHGIWDTWKKYDYIVQLYSLYITIDLVNHVLIHIFLCFISLDIDFHASVTYGVYHSSFSNLLNRCCQYHFFAVCCDYRAIYRYELCPDTSQAPTLGIPEGNRNAAKRRSSVPHTVRYMAICLQPICCYLPEMSGRKSSMSS